MNTPISNIHREIIKYKTAYPQIINARKRIM